MRNIVGFWLMHDPDLMTSTCTGCADFVDLALREAAFRRDPKIAVPDRMNSIHNGHLRFEIFDPSGRQIVFTLAEREGVRQDSDHVVSPIGLAQF